MNIEGQRHLTNVLLALIGLYLSLTQVCPYFQHMVQLLASEKWALFSNISSIIILLTDIFLVIAFFVGLVVAVMATGTLWVGSRVGGILIGLITFTIFRGGYKPIVKGFWSIMPSEKPTREAIENHLKVIGYVDLSRRDLRKINLDKFDLQGVNLSKANLSGANFEGANLSKANLAGANLSGAQLTGANLTGANLERANLRGANLKANLRDVNLKGVKFDNKTQWPDGVAITLIGGVIED